MSSVAAKSSLISANIEPNDEKSEQLKKLIRNYFQSNVNSQTIENIIEPTHDESMDSIIISDINRMIVQYPENTFTGRSLARIFHGVNSPVYPATIWFRCKYWRAHINSDFNHIINLANSEILRLRNVN